MCMRQEKGERVCMFTHLHISEWDIEVRGHEGVVFLLPSSGIWELTQHVRLGHSLGKPLPTEPSQWSTLL